MTVVVAIDLDYTLAQLLECAIAWHNETKGTKLTVKDVTSLDKLWGAKKEAEEKVLDFYHSTQFNTQVAAVDKANEILKPLRKYFTLYAVTDRPRVVETPTREWIDQHFPGVFDKLIFVDEDNKEDIIPRKKEIYEEFKVKIAIGADASILSKVSEEIPHAIQVGAVPWANKNGANDKKLIKVGDWIKADAELQKLIKQLDIKPADKVFAGPKLSRYTDDLVTVSTKKPAVFYANIINSKFTVQKQETIRLQAIEGAITTAVQAAEILKSQKNATVTKISTRYVVRRTKGAQYRTPKIEVVLQRVVRND